MDTAFLARLTGAARTTVRTIEDRTPADRDRALDGLRALALLAVPVGHWLIEGFTRDADGGAAQRQPADGLRRALARQLGVADARHLLPGRRPCVGAVPAPRHRAGRAHRHLAARPDRPAGPPGARGDGRLGDAAPGPVRPGGAGGDTADRGDAGDPAAVVRRCVCGGHRADAVLHACRPADGRLGRGTAGGGRGRRGLPALRAVRRRHAVLAESAQSAARLAVRVSARGLLGRAAARQARGLVAAARRCRAVRRAAAVLPLPGEHGRCPRTGPDELPPAVAAGPGAGRRPVRRRRPAP